MAKPRAWWRLPAGIMLAGFLLSPARSAPGQVRGRQLFLNYCANCHGRRGNGIGARLALKPPALDLTGFQLSPALIRKVLEQGVPGTGMAAWDSLPPEQLSAIAAYTASLGRSDHLSSQARLAPITILRRAGRRVYVAHCVRCHGEQGRGNGPEASRYRPPPPSFAEMRPTYAAAARVIAGGVPGSAMASWPLLTKAEVQAVTAYIRSLYRTPESPVLPSSPPRRLPGR